MQLTINDYNNTNKSVDIVIDKNEIVEQQDKSFVSLANSVCRIKIVDDDGSFAWFVVTPMFKNNKPSVSVEFIAEFDRGTVSKKIIGKFREHVKYNEN
jgi:hypothetical protein